MKWFRFPLAFAAFFVALAAYAGVGESRLTCVDLVTNFHENLDFNPLVEAHSAATMAKHELPTESTVTFEAEVAGQHGGKGLLLRKTGAKWVSVHAEGAYDPQGDPRTFVDVLGDKAAAFFGFKILSDDLVQVPDHAEFTGAIKKVNDWLVKNGHVPIAITYYLGPSELKVIVAEYLQKFALLTGIPIAPGGNHLLHDLGFHTGGIFIPRELLEFRVETTKYMEKFIAFAEKRFEHDEPKKKALRFFAYIWRMHQTEKIDLATATPNLAIIELLRRPGADHLNALENVVTLLTNYGDHPEEFLNNSIGAVYHDTPFINVNGNIGEYAFVDVARVRPHRANLPIEILEDVFVEFAHQNPVSNHLIHLSEEAKKQEVKERYCKEITLRRQLIRDASIALSSGN